MPIRLLFLLIFLPSTFLSSLNVSHVDALILYEPMPLGWNNRFFQGSQDPPPLLRLLYNLKPSDLPSYKVALAEENISALFRLKYRSERKYEENQTNNVSESSTSLNESTQSSELGHPVFSLQRRKVSSDEYTDDSTSTRQNLLKNKQKALVQFAQETDTSSNEGRNSADEERTSTTLTGTNETLSDAPKNASKPRKLAGNENVSKVDPLDAGMKGAIAIGGSTILLALLLILRKILLRRTPQDKDINVGTTINDMGGFDISGPLNGGQATDKVWGLRPGSKTENKDEGLVRTKSQAIHPVVRRASENTVSLPSKVKVAGERNRVRPPPSKQGSVSTSSSGSSSMT